MTHERYIKRGDKIYGPYIYESYRDKNGKVRKRYLGKGKKKKKISSFWFLLAGIFLFLSLFYTTDSFFNEGRITKAFLSLPSSFSHLVGFTVSEQKKKTEKKSEGAGESRGKGGEASEKVSKGVEQKGSGGAQQSGKQEQASGEQQGSKEGQQGGKSGAKEGEQKGGESGGEQKNESGTGGAKEGGNAGGAGNRSESGNKTSGGGVLTNQTQKGNESFSNKSFEGNKTGGMNKNFSLNNSLTNFSSNFSGNFSLNESLNLNKSAENLTQNIIGKVYCGRVEVGKPVKCVKVFEVSSLNNVSLEIPRVVKNFSVVYGAKIDEEIKSLSRGFVKVNWSKGNESGLNRSRGMLGVGALTGRVSKEISGGGLLTRFFDWLFGRFSLTGFVISDKQEFRVLNKSRRFVLHFERAKSKRIGVVYYAPGPEKKERKIRHGKRVEIGADDLLGYTNVSLSVGVRDLNVKVGDPRLRVYWDTTYSDALRLGLIKKNQKMKGDEVVRVLMKFNASDTDDDGFVDSVSWVVPHLSNQSFDVVIEITKAEHLDSNRSDLSSVYSEVRALDGVWSEKIYHGEYVRVTFERNLTKNNDITFYARNLQGKETYVEVYLENSDEKIAEFPVITNESYYKVYLDGMSGEHDVFDLKVVNKNNDKGAYLEFDHIVDPGWKDHDTFGYLGKDSDSGDVEYFWDDISATGTALNLADDGVSSNLGLGFTMHFYENTFSSVWVDNNGLVFFSDPSGMAGSTYTNEELPTTNYYDFVAAFWDDICDVEGNVYYEQKGSSPNRYFIVQWDNRPIYDGGCNSGYDVSFQVVLYENSSDIQINYNSVSTAYLGHENGASATVGIENSNSDIALQRSYNEDVLNDGYAVRFFYTNLSEMQVWNVRVTPGFASVDDNLSVDYDSVISTEDVVDWRVGSNSLAVVNLPFANNVSSVSSGAIPDFTTFHSNATLGDGSSSWAPHWQSSGGILGGYYKYDGVDDEITIWNSSAGVFPKSEMTVMAWVRLRSHNNWNDIVYHPDWWQAGKCAWHLVCDSGGVGYDVGCDQGNPSVSAWVGTSYLPLNTWTHVAGTYNGSMVRLYINGSLVASGVNDTYQVFYNDTSYLYAGTSWGHFNGSIDEIKIFNFSMSPAQIKAIYDSERAGHSWNKIVSDTLREFSSATWKAAVTPVNSSDVGRTNYSNEVELTPGIYSPCDYYLSSCKSSGWEAGKKYCLSQDVSIAFGDCMVFDNGSAYLDLRGYTISGSGWGEGIKSGNHSGVTVFNGTVKGFWWGIDMWNVSQIKLYYLELNNTATDILLQGGSDFRIHDVKLFTQGSSGSTGFDFVGSDVKAWNITASGFNLGGSVRNSGGVLLENLSLKGCSTGLSVWSTWDSVIVRNSVFENNLFWDFKFEIKDDILGDYVCRIGLENVTGTGGYPIVFYNKSVNVSNKVFSEVVTCAADNSNFTNITITDGSSSYQNNGFFVWRTDNSVFSDIKSSDNHYGVYVNGTSSSNKFYRLVLNDNRANGLLMAEGSGNEFYDVSVNHSLSKEGVWVWKSSGNYFEDLNSSNSVVGLYLQNSTGNVVAGHSYIQENTQNDLWIKLGALSDCDNNVSAVGSGGREIVYRNYSDSFSDDVFSEVVLCGANWSSFDNVSVEGSDSHQNNGFYVFYSSHLDLKGINSSGNYYGLWGIFSDVLDINGTNLSVRDCHFDSNNKSGVKIGSVGDLRVDGVYASDNGGDGVSFSSVWDCNVSSVYASGNSGLGTTIDGVNCVGFNISAEWNTGSGAGATFKGEDCAYRKVEANSNSGGHGVSVQGNNISFEDVVGNNNGDTGFEVDNSNYTVLRNGYFGGNQKGISVNNNVFHGVFRNVSLISNSFRGMEVIDSRNNSFYDFYLFNDANDGVYLEQTNNLGGVSCSYNRFYNFSIDQKNTREYGVYISKNSFSGYGPENNLFVNLNVTNTTKASIYDEPVGGRKNYLFYNNSYGEVKWIESGFLENLSVAGDMVYGRDVLIRKNFARVDSSVYGADGLNSSARISFFGMPGSFIDPVILRNGRYVCNATTTPSCYNFTDLNAQTVVFNVSSWSNYSISNELDAPSVSFESPTPSNGSSVFDDEGIFVNLSSSDKNKHYSFVDIDGSLILWMRMDDINASGDPVDISGHGHNGSAYNGAAQNTTDYAFGDSFDFDGSDDYIDLGGISELDMLGSNGKNFSVSLWVNFDQQPSVWFVDFPVFSQTTASGQGAMWIWGRASDDHLASNLGGGGSASLDLGDVPVGKWYHVVLTWDGNTLKGYVNGSLIDSNNAVTIDDDDGNFAIGVDDVDAPNYYMMGKVDELVIFNRTLNESEVRALYDASSNQYFYNFTDSDALYRLGWHSFKGYAVDNSGNKNETEQRWILVKDSSPNPPSDVVLNATDSDNRTSRDLVCYANVSDPDDSSLDVYVRWWKNGVLNLTLSYNNVPTSVIFNSTLSSGNTTKHENWSCSVRTYDGKSYSVWTNSSLLEILNTPPMVTGLSPDDWSATTDRTPTFSWTYTDDDGDSLTYTWVINETQYSAGFLCSDDRIVDSIGSASYTPSNDLKCLYEKGYYYSWKVRPYDGEDYGAWFGYHINITANLSIRLLNANVSFGSMAPGSSDDTSDNSPQPFLLENDGNCFLNVSLNSSSLWSTEPSTSSYYRFKADNSSEPGSFDWAHSITSWTNMPIGSVLTGIVGMNYTDATDSCEVDVAISVPNDEPPGTKSANLVFSTSLGE